MTDRDLVVRALAMCRDPEHTRVGDVCSSSDVATLEPDASIEDAVRIMRERAIRRLPVTEAGCPVGVVSIGDLALERDEASALADISAAHSNQ